MCPQIQPATSSSEKQLAVFVHGFGSSAECWNPLLKLLKHDPKIAEAFDLACFEYPTQLVSLNPLRRIPRLQEIAKLLAGFLADKRYAGYQEITLVGHSQGGLVIQCFLVSQLQEGKGEKLENIRQVLLVATPNLGSTLLSGVRKLVSHFSFNPQERTLRVLNPEISDIRAVVSERIVNAVRKEATAWQIPIQAFGGTEDGVVLPASARGPFHNYEPLPGDHFSILLPTDHNDLRYRRLSDALLQPKGHKRVFEVDLYEQEIKVNPLPANYQKETPKKRIVRSDNLAQVNRSVTFSRKNTCTDLFELRYRTRNDGYIEAVMSHENEAPSQEQSRYDDYGTEVTFKFTPKQSEQYKLNLTIYKGFDEGNRDVHFHLGRRAYYKKYRLTLDLTAYLASGYRITNAPKLYFHDQDRGDHKLCSQRTLENPLDCVESDPEGVWKWELSKIREGVIDAAWDVAKD